MVIMSNGNLRVCTNQNFFSNLIKGLCEKTHADLQPGLTHFFKHPMT